jgi:biopolymer transport protein ExbD
MRRRLAYVPVADQPMSELNTTPLIDVMLVLLVMFIIIVPVLSHKVTIDLPSVPHPPGTPPTIHTLSLDASNHLYFDGQAISLASLPARLAAVREDLNSELHLSADGAARYEVYDEVLAEVKRAGITQLGLVGNERFESDINR